MGQKESAAPQSTNLRRSAAAGLASWGRRRNVFAAVAWLAVVVVVMLAGAVVDLDGMDVALLGLAAAVSVVLGSRLLAASSALRSTRFALTHESATIEQSFIDARVGMALTAMDMRWARVNPALCRMLGYSEQELVGHSPNEFTHPDDVKLTEGGFHTMSTDPRAGLDLEKRYVARDGSIIWALVTVSGTRDPATGDEMHIAQIQDITLRKRGELALSESEGRWQTLLAHLQEIVVLVDLSGLVTYTTPSIQQWLGYEPEELLGTQLLDQIHPDDREGVGRTFEDVQPGEPRSVTHRVRHRDGGWHTLQSTLISLRDDPTIRAVLIASVDITEHVAIEEDRQRLELERRVSHRLEAVGQLAAGIAHEINTPLQFVGDSVSFLQDAVTELLGLVSGYQQLMSAEVAISHKERQAMMREAEEKADLEYLNERIPAAFERTADGVARVRSIVQAMKRFSHAGGTELRPADLNEAIETTLEVCRNEYKYVAIVGLELGELPLVTCNAGEINQVLLNLIVNAAQAIEEDRARSEGDAADRPLGRIRISTRVEGAYAVIQIADNGPGIPKELQDRIYEPFFTTKEVGRGTGQGLALARTTIDHHEGSLECDSAPGAGTTFTIRLPLQSQQEQYAIAGAERDAVQ
jgi:two-component system, NtrC family, sensor kinase